MLRDRLVVHPDANAVGSHRFEEAVSVDPDPTAQARRCLEIAVQALGQAGGAASDVVRTRTYLVDAADAEAVGEAHREMFSGIRPASTMVVVGGLLDPRWKVEIEMEAVLGS